METKTSIKKVCKVGRILGYMHIKAIKIEGRAGGIGLLWNNDEVKLKVEWKIDVGAYSSTFSQH